MAPTSSIIVPRMVVIVGRAGCRRKSVIVFRLFVTGRPARSAAMPVLFSLSGPKIGFSPRRGDTLPG